MKPIRIKVKETNEKGELFEVSAYINYCSVFIDGERKCRFYKKEDIQILEDENVNEA